MPAPDGAPTRAEMDLGTVLAALADPLRRGVVADLAAEADDTERNCASFELPVAKSTRTHHFRVLREAGLVTTVDRGNRLTVSLRRADVQARFPGLLDLLAEDARG